MSNTCTGCHTSVNNTVVPDGQLELTNGPDALVPDHFHAYRELLFTDNEQELGAMGLQDRMVPGPIDPITGLPTMVPVPVPPSMSPAGAVASNTFFSRFDTGGYARRFSDT